MNSEQAALQLRMEGSRRGKGNREKGLPTPDPYVDGGNGVKIIVYNTKKEKKRDRQKREKEEKEREKESKRLKKYNSKKEEFITLSPSIRACPRILFASVCV